MAKLIWGAPGTRTYEMGVEQCVLYLNNIGYAWPGVISVTESPEGGEPREYYQDGYKYLNLLSAEEYKASIEAFGCPKEFLPCDGTQMLYNGLFVTQQQRKPFNFSYKTLTGNDTVGSAYGYKLHLVYNARAASENRSNTTVSGDVELQHRVWNLTTRPPIVPGFRPTSHFVIDSTKTPAALMTKIQDRLYGTATVNATMPTAEELISIFKTFVPTV